MANNPDSQLRTTNVGKPVERVENPSAGKNTDQPANVNPAVKHEETAGDDLSRNDGTRPGDTPRDTEHSPADRGTGTDSVLPDHQYDADGNRILNVDEAEAPAERQPVRSDASPDALDRDGQ